MCASFRRRLPPLLECCPSALPRCQDPLGPSVVGTKLLTVFAQTNHWSLLILEVLPSHKVQAQLFDGIPGRNTLAAERLASRIGQVWDKLVLQVEEICWFPQVEAHCCGAIARLHASRHLLGHTVPACQLVSELEDISCLENLLPRAWASGGLSAEQEQAFTAILLERGHPQQVQERVKAAVSKVGANAIAKALAHRNPWPTLKVAASQPGTAFKYVTAEELEAQIEQRATQRFGSAVKAGKAKKQSKSAKKEHFSSWETRASNLPSKTSQNSSRSRQSPSASLPIEIKSALIGRTLCDHQSGVSSMPFLAFACVRMVLAPETARDSTEQWTNL